MTRRLPIVAPALMAVWALLAACGAGRSVSTATTTSTSSSTSSTTSTSVATTVSTTGSTTGSTRATTVIAPTTTTIAAISGTIHLTDADDGKSITVRKGTTIVVVLNSTYWMFASSSNPGVLQPQGDPVTAPAPVGTCVPGGGCGTVSITYRAVGDGQATIAASRTSCGEAMTCTGKAGSYSVQVVVTG